MRGLYRLARMLPSKADRYLSFAIQDVSFHNSGDIVRLLTAPVDAMTAKRSDPQMSVYFAQGFEEPKEILPNQLRSQYVFSDPHPDLYVSTALKGHQWKQFGALFRGLTLSRWSTPWEYLDSPDITPFWDTNGDNIGVQVCVHNCGGPTTSRTQLQVRTYFLPFSRVQLRPPYQISPPLMGYAALAVPELPHHSRDEYHNFDCHFDSLVELGTDVQAERGFLAEVDGALAITVVRIDVAEGELVTSNN